MTNKEIMLLAAEMVLNSSSIIIQFSDEEDVCVFKFHKLDCPNVKISLALNGKKEREEIIGLDEAFPLLCDAISFSGYKNN